MNNLLLKAKMKLDNFKNSKKGAEIIEIIFGVVIAGVICVVAYKGIKGIVDNTVTQANSAFTGGTTGSSKPTLPTTPEYGA